MPKSKHQQEAAALLEIILNNSETLIMVLDRDGHIQHFNSACENLSGYEEDEVRDEYLWDCAFVPQGGDSDCRQIFQVLKAEGEYPTGEECGRWLTRDGELVPIDWRIVPMRDAEGELECLVALGSNITTQRGMQKILRERAAESRALFEQAAVGIAYVAPEGHWIDVNESLCEIVGYERDQLLATTFQAITYPEDLDITQDYFNKILRDEIQTYSMEKRYIRSDGSLTWVSLTVSLVKDMEGRPDYFISLIRDINQRKETELLLRNSERQLREAQRITHIGSWELELFNNKLHWSDEIYRIFEIDKEKFGASYEAFLNAIHPDDREAVNRAYTASLENKTAYAITHRLLMSDGRIKWVKESCETEFASHGGPIRSLGTVQDITEQYRIETELRELNRTLERRVSDRTYELASERNFIGTILDTTSALVVVLDDNGEIIRVNRACELLTGYLQSELFGKNLSDLLPESVRRPDSAQQLISTLAQDGESHTYEFEWRCKNGETRFISWSSSAVKNYRGELDYIIITGVDITEHMAAERELVQARDKAEQANRAKSEFLSRMTHELRTPLNAVLGFSQLLQSDMESPLNPTQHASVTEILRAGNHLLGLINEILDISRVEAGRLNLNMEPLVLGPLLEECIALIQTQAEQRGIQLQLDSSVYEVGRALADEIRIKEVVLNLLSNAVKYNRDHGLVRVACSTQANGDIRIAVYDTGEGLSAEQQAILFVPFERLDADIKAIPGTGIGLALSKQLTKLMGGSIGVESEVGKGTMFWVQLSTPSVSGTQA